MAPLRHRVRIENGISAVAALNVLGLDERSRTREQ
jgi:hypothetical protein